jgi:UDP-N-acetylglucosamine:LPS N-acetylglucosamine transferase
VARVEARDVCHEGAGPRVLIVSATIGSGHQGVATELERRLVAEGAEVRVVDFLDALPARLGPAMAALYHAQLRHAPWTYGALYRLRFCCDDAWRGINAAYTALARPAVDRWIDEVRPDAVVSLYPLAGMVLGTLRARRYLRVPVATFITDFGVHPLWVHPGVDLHLAVHPRPAEEAARRSAGGDARTHGPVVRAQFRDAPSARAAGRAVLGVGGSARVVVVSGGSWGVGRLERTVDILARSGRYVPVVLCGRDEGLRRRMAACGARALGWTDEVAEILAAADALVDNAGGLTCLEALASGVPVVTYAPIDGHGRHNAYEMAMAGVTRWPRSPEGLLRTLDLLTTPGDERDDALAAGAAMFLGDASKDILDLARAHEAVARAS